MLESRDVLRTAFLLLTMPLLTLHVSLFRFTPDLLYLTTCTSNSALHRPLTFASILLFYNDDLYSHHPLSHSTNPPFPPVPRHHETLTLVSIIWNFPTVETEYIDREMCVDSFLGYSIRASKTCNFIKI